MSRRQVALLVAFALLLGVIWGHWQEMGAGVPPPAADLGTTTTCRVFGRWPYFVVDAAGFHLAWPGLWIGLCCTAFAGWRVVYWFSRWARPAVPPAGRSPS